MKFSLFPQETHGLELLRDLSLEVRGCVHILSQMLGAAAEEQHSLVEELGTREIHATDLHYSLLTHLRTSFVNPLPREDLYTLSRLLHLAVEQLSGAGEQLALAGVSQLSRRASEQLEVLGRLGELAGEAVGQLLNLDDLEDTWLEMVRLSKRSNRTHRAWLVEISDFQKTSSIIKHRSLAEQLLLSANSLRAVAEHLGRVLVKES